MSCRLRFGFAAFMLAAGFSTPAASNPLTDILSPNAAPEAAAAGSAAAPEACLPQPGKSTAPGQHWVYRHEGRRRCWFQAAEGPAVARKPVHHRAARQRVAAPEENESAPRNQTAVEDARAEMLGSARAETPQPATPPAQTPPAQTPEAMSPDPAIKLVKVVPVRTAGAAAMVPPPPLAAKPGPDQLAPDQPAPPRQVDVEKLLAEAPAASNEVASATPVAVPGAMSGGGGGWTAHWLGALLMTLGGVALLSSSGTLRRIVMRLSSTLRNFASLRA